ncbi:MAG: hypothetical protein LBR07_01115, partial [Puniceicoccales bacterium]|nr:hypothetical protein [Puniceicoccales bacterium]
NTGPKVPGLWIDADGDGKPEFYPANNSTDPVTGDPIFDPNKDQKQNDFFQNSGPGDLNIIIGGDTPTVINHESSELDSTTKIEVKPGAELEVAVTGGIGGNDPDKAPVIFLDGPTGTEDGGKLTIIEQPAGLDTDGDGHSDTGIGAKITGDGTVVIGDNAHDNDPTNKNGTGDKNYGVELTNPDNEIGVIIVEEDARLTVTDPGNISKNGETDILLKDNGTLIIDTDTTPGGTFELNDIVHGENPGDGNVIKIGDGDLKLEPGSTTPTIDVGKLVVDEGSVTVTDNGVLSGTTDIYIVPGNGNDDPTKPPTLIIGPGTINTFPNDIINAGGTSDDSGVPGLWNGTAGSDGNDGGDDTAGKIIITGDLGFSSNITKPDDSTPNLDIVIGGGNVELADGIKEGVDWQIDDEAKLTVDISTTPTGGTGTTPSEIWEEKVGTGKININDYNNEADSTDPGYKPNPADQGDGTPGQLIITSNTGDDLTIPNEISGNGTIKVDLDGGELNLTGTTGGKDGDSDPRNDSTFNGTVDISDRDGDGKGTTINLGGQTVAEKTDTYTDTTGSPHEYLDANGNPTDLDTDPVSGQPNDPNPDYNPNYGQPTAGTHTDEWQYIDGSTGEKTNNPLDSVTGLPTNTANPTYGQPITDADEPLYNPNAEALQDATIVVGPGGVLVANQIGNNPGSSDSTGVDRPDGGSDGVWGTTDDADHHVIGGLVIGGGEIKLDTTHPLEVTGDITFKIPDGQNDLPKTTISVDKPDAAELGDAIKETGNANILIQDDGFNLIKLITSDKTTGASGFPESLLDDITIALNDLPNGGAGQGTKTTLSPSTQLTGDLQGGNARGTYSELAAGVDENGNLVITGVLKELELVGKGGENIGTVLTTADGVTITTPGATEIFNDATTIARNAALDTAKTALDTAAAAYDAAVAALAGNPTDPTLIAARDAALNDKTAAEATFKKLGDELGSGSELQAKLTGTGDIILHALFNDDDGAPYGTPGDNDIITITNPNNNYTGTTAVGSGTVVLGVSNALGNTTGLVILPPVTDADISASTGGIIDGWDRNRDVDTDDNSDGTSTTDSAAARVVLPGKGDPLPSGGTAASGVTQTVTGDVILGANTNGGTALDIGDEAKLTVTGGLFVGSVDAGTDGTLGTGDDIVHGGSVITIEGAGNLTVKGDDSVVLNTTAPAVIITDPTGSLVVAGGDFGSPDATAPWLDNSAGGRFNITGGETHLLGAMDNTGIVTIASTATVFAENADALGQPSGTTRSSITNNGTIEFLSDVSQRGNVGEFAYTVSADITGLGTLIIGGKDHITHHADETNLDNGSDPTVDAVRDEDVTVTLTGNNSLAKVTVHDDSTVVISSIANVRANGTARPVFTLKGDGESNLVTDENPSGITGTDAPNTPRDAGGTLRIDTLTGSDTTTGAQTTFDWNDFLKGNGTLEITGDGDVTLAGDNKNFTGNVSVLPESIYSPGTGTTNPTNAPGDPAPELLIKTPTGAGTATITVNDGANIEYTADITGGTVGNSLVIGEEAEVAINSGNTLFTGDIGHDGNIAGSRTSAGSDSTDEGTTGTLVINGSGNTFQHKDGSALNFTGDPTGTAAGDASEGGFNVTINGNNNTLNVRVDDNFTDATCTINGTGNTFAPIVVDGVNTHADSSDTFGDKDTVKVIVNGDITVNGPATLPSVATGGYDFNNQLDGSGTLTISGGGLPIGVATVPDEASFTSSAPFIEITNQNNTFDGTVAIKNGYFILNEHTATNTNAYYNFSSPNLDLTAVPDSAYTNNSGYGHGATLVLGPGSLALASVRTTNSASTQPDRADKTGFEIGGLVFAGGSILLDYDQTGANNDSAGDAENSGALGPNRDATGAWRTEYRVGQNASGSAGTIRIDNSASVIRLDGFNMSSGFSSDLDAASTSSAAGDARSTQLARQSIIDDYLADPNDAQKLADYNSAVSLLKPLYENIAPAVGAAYDAVREAENGTVGVAAAERGREAAEAALGSDTDTTAGTAYGNLYVANAALEAASLAEGQAQAVYNAASAAWAAFSGVPGAAYPNVPALADPDYAAYQAYLAADSALSTAQTTRAAANSAYSNAVSALADANTLLATRVATLNAANDVLATAKQNLDAAIELMKTTRPTAPRSAADDLLAGVSGTTAVLLIRGEIATGSEGQTVKLADAAGNLFGGDTGFLQIYDENGRTSTADHIPTGVWVRYNIQGYADPNGDYGAGLYARLGITKFAIEHGKEFTLTAEPTNNSAAGNKITAQLVSEGYDGTSGKSITGADGTLKLDASPIVGGDAYGNTALVLANDNSAFLGTIEIIGGTVASSNVNGFGGEDTTLKLDDGSGASVSNTPATADLGGYNQELKTIIDAPDGSSIIIVGGAAQVTGGGAGGGSDAYTGLVVKEDTALTGTLDINGGKATFEDTLSLGGTTVLGDNGSLTLEGDGNSISGQLITGTGAGGTITLTGGGTTTLDAISTLNPEDKFVITGSTLIVEPNDLGGNALSDASVQLNGTANLDLRELDHGNNPFGGSTNAIGNKITNTGDGWVTILPGHGDDPDQNIELTGTENQLGNVRVSGEAILAVSKPGNLGDNAEIFLQSVNAETGLDASFGGILQINADTDDWNLIAPVNGGADTTIRKTGTGDIQITDAGAFTGTLNIINGSITLDADDALGRTATVSFVPPAGMPPLDTPPVLNLNAGVTGFASPIIGGSNGGTVNITAAVATGNTDATEHFAYLDSPLSKSSPDDPKNLQVNILQGDVKLGPTYPTDGQGGTNVVDWRVAPAGTDGASLNVDGYVVQKLGTGSLEVSNNGAAKGVIALVEFPNGTADGDLTLANNIAGDGTLAITLGGDDRQLTFTGDTSDFTGTLSLTNGTLDLSVSGNADTADHVSVVLNRGATLDAKDATHTVGELTFNGGTVKITPTAIDDPNGVPLTATNGAIVDHATGGTIDIGDAFPTASDTAADLLLLAARPILQQDEGGATITLISVNGSNNKFTNAAVADLTLKVGNITVPAGTGVTLASLPLQGGNGLGDFGTALRAADNGDLVLTNTLTKLTLVGTAANAVVLDAPKSSVTGTTGNGAEFHALITGTGDLRIKALADARDPAATDVGTDPTPVVTLNNGSNDYSGATFVDDGVTLRVGENFALGNTKSVTVGTAGTTGAALQLPAGLSANIGAAGLTVNSRSNVVLGVTGTGATPANASSATILTVTGDTTFATGSTLTLNAAGNHANTLKLLGDTVTFAAGSQITGGAKGVIELGAGTSAHFANAQTNGIDNLSGLTVHNDAGGIIYLENVTALGASTRGYTAKVTLNNARSEFVIVANIAGGTANINSDITGSVAGIGKTGTITVNHAATLSGLLQVATLNVNADTTLDSYYAFDALSEANAFTTINIASGVQLQIEKQSDVGGTKNGTRAAAVINNDGVLRLSNYNDGVGAPATFDNSVLGGIVELKGSSVTLTTHSKNTVEKFVVGSGSTLAASSSGVKTDLGSMTTTGSNLGDAIVELDAGATLNYYGSGTLGNQIVDTTANRSAATVHLYGTGVPSATLTVTNRANSGSPSWFVYQSAGLVTFDGAATLGYTAGTTGTPAFIEIADNARAQVLDTGSITIPHQVIVAPGAKFTVTSTEGSVAFTEVDYTGVDVAAGAALTVNAADKVTFAYVTGAGVGFANDTPAPAAVITVAARAADEVRALAPATAATAATYGSAAYPANIFVTDDYSEIADLRVTSGIVTLGNSDGYAAGTDYLSDALAKANDETGGALTLGNAAAANVLRGTTGIAGEPLHVATIGALTLSAGAYLVYDDINELHVTGAVALGGATIRINVDAIVPLAPMPVTAATAIAGATSEKSYFVQDEGAAGAYLISTPTGGATSNVSGSIRLAFLDGSAIPASGIGRDAWQDDAGNPVPPSAAAPAAHAVLNYYFGVAVDADNTGGADGVQLTQRLQEINLLTGNFHIAATGVDDGDHTLTARITGAGDVTFDATRAPAAALANAANDFTGAATIIGDIRLATDNALGAASRVTIADPASKLVVGVGYSNVTGSGTVIENAVAVTGGIAQTIGALDNSAGGALVFVNNGSTLTVTGGGTAGNIYAATAYVQDLDYINTLDDLLGDIAGETAAFIPLQSAAGASKLIVAGTEPLHFNVARSTLRFPKVVVNPGATAQLDVLDALGNSALVITGDGSTTSTAAAANGTVLLNTAGATTVADTFLTTLAGNLRFVVGLADATGTADATAVTVANQANTYGGGTIVNPNSRLKVADATAADTAATAALGTGAVTVRSAATLEYATGGTGVAGSLELGVHIANDLALENGAVLLAETAGNVAWQSGAVSLDAISRATKTGDGELLLSGYNAAVAGDLLVAAGTLTFATDGASGSAAIRNAATVQIGADAQLGGAFSITAFANDITGTAADARIIVRADADNAGRADPPSGGLALTSAINGAASVSFLAGTTRFTGTASNVAKWEIASDYDNGSAAGAANTTLRLEGNPLDVLGHGAEVRDATGLDYLVVIGAHSFLNPTGLSNAGPAAGVHADLPALEALAIGYGHTEETNARLDIVTAGDLTLTGVFTGNGDIAVNLGRDDSDGTVATALRALDQNAYAGGVSALLHLASAARLSLAPGSLSTNLTGAGAPVIGGETVEITPFTGALRLTNTVLDLTQAHIAELASAALSLRAGSLAALSTPATGETIGAIEFAGGSLLLHAVGSDIIPALSAKVVSIATDGAIALDAHSFIGSFTGSLFTPAFSSDEAPAPSGVNFLREARVHDDARLLVRATETLAVGTAGRTVALLDANSGFSVSEQTVATYTNVTAFYDYRAIGGYLIGSAVALDEGMDSVSADADAVTAVFASGAHTGNAGIFGDYGLTRLDIHDGETLTLDSDAADAGFADAEYYFGLQITSHGENAADGTGRLLLKGGTTIVLNNNSDETPNAYRGTTELAPGASVRLYATDALGNTGHVVIGDGATLTLAGDYAQHIRAAGTAGALGYAPVAGSEGDIINRGSIVLAESAALSAVILENHGAFDAGSASSATLATVANNGSITARDAAALTVATLTNNAAGSVAADGSATITITTAGNAGEINAAGSATLVITDLESTGTVSLDDAAAGTVANFASTGGVSVAGDAVLTVSTLFTSDDGGTVALAGNAALHLSATAAITGDNALSATADTQIVVGNGTAGAVTTVTGDNPAFAGTIAVTTGATLNAAGAGALGSTAEARVVLASTAAAPAASALATDDGVTPAAAPAAADAAPATLNVAGDGVFAPTLSTDNAAAEPFTTAPDVHFLADARITLPHDNSDLVAAIYADTGTVRAEAQQAFGPLSPVTVAAGATVELASPSDTQGDFIVTNAFHGNGTLVVAAGDVTLDAPAASSVKTLQVSGGATARVAGAFSEAGVSGTALNIADGGTARLVHLAANAVFDSIAIQNGGTLSFAAFSQEGDDTSAFRRATVRSLSTGAGASTGGVIEFRVDYAAAAAAGAQLATGDLSAAEGHGDHLTITEAVAAGTQFRVRIIPLTHSPDGAGRIVLVTSEAGATESTLFTTGSYRGNYPVAETGSYAYILRQGDGSAALGATNEWSLVGGTHSRLAEAMERSGAAAANYWHMELDNLLARRGDLRSTVEKAYELIGEGVTRIEPLLRNVSRDTWFRGYGWQADIDSKVTGSAWREYTGGGDVGTDAAFAFDKGLVFTGAYAGYGYTRRMDNGYGKGTNETVRGGLYATWLGKNGWWVEGVAKINYYENDYVVKSLYGERDTAFYDNWALGVSGETGWKIDLGDKWFLEPEAQISYAYFQSARYSTKGTLPLSVYQNARDTLQLRGAVRLGREFDTSTGKWAPYVRGHIAQLWTWGGRIETGDNFDARVDLDGFRWGVGAGVTWETKGWGQFYGEYEYIRADKYTLPWKFNVGWRFRW